MLAGRDDQADSVQQLPVAIAVGDAGKVQVFSQDKSSQDSAVWPPELVLDGGPGFGETVRHCRAAAQDFIAPACPPEAAASSRDTIHDTKFRQKVLT
jgi:hypothetical protein